MKNFRRKKLIKAGIHGVEIMGIEETTSNNGNLFFKIRMKRKSDKATRTFWISEESYLIDKLIDLFFKDDERDTFGFDEFIGKEIVIVVKANESDYYNITDIKPIENEECKEDEEYEEDYFLENHLFKENKYDEQDEDDLFDDDILFSEDDEIVISEDDEI